MYRLYLTFFNAQKGCKHLIIVWLENHVVERATLLLASCNPFNLAYFVVVAIVLLNDFAFFDSYFWLILTV